MNKLNFLAIASFVSLFAFLASAFIMCYDVIINVFAGIEIRSWPIILFFISFIFLYFFSKGWKSLAVKKSVQIKRENITNALEKAIKLRSEALNKKDKPFDPTAIL